MAVPAGPTEKRYTGNGVTTIFTIPFLLLAASDLDVFLDGVEIVSGFTITGVGNPTSTITFTTAPPNLSSILLNLNVPFERLNDYQENGDFLASTVNRDFDRIWQALKQLYRVSTRSLTLGFFDVDGAGAYRAKGNKISDLADPVSLQDAVTKNWVTLLLDSVSGAVNTTTGILYDAGTLFDHLRFGVARTVNSIADLRLLSGARNQRAFALGYYANGDGGGGSYFIDQADTTSVDNGGTVIVGLDGVRWKLATTTFVSVRQFGAKGDWNGTSGTNDTLAFQRAAATGLNIFINKGSFFVRDMTTLAVTGQRIFGEDKYSSTVFVDSTFNLSATGIFRSASTGIEYENFAVRLAQPDTSVFANLTMYPPVVSGMGIPGQRVKSMVIAGAIVGLDWRDNVGQSIVEDVTISAFSKAFRLDGSIDSVRFDKVHVWPAYLTTNQTLIMTQAGGCTAWEVGRADDLQVTNCLTYCWESFNFFSGTRANPGPCFGTIVGCDLDGFGGITMTAGTISVVGGFQSSGQLNAVKLKLGGGNLSYTGVQFQIGANFPAGLNTAWMTIGGTGVLSMTGCQFYKPNDACLFILSGGKLLLTGNNFIYQPDAGFALPIISAPAGIVFASGNELSPLGTTGTQTFFSASADAAHVITRNHLYGAQISAPSGLGFYGDNIQGVVNKDIYNNLVIGGIRTKTATVTANASGVATWAHGIAAGNLKVLFVSGFYRGASTEAVNMPNISVDGTNIIATQAAAANAHVRVSITYIETSDAGW